MRTHIYPELHYRGQNAKDEAREGVTTKYACAADLAKALHAQCWDALEITHNGVVVGGIKPDHEGVPDWWGIRVPANPQFATTLNGWCGQ